MEPPRRRQRIAAALALCLVAALISTTRADCFMPGEWDGKWISEFGHSTGEIYTQIYPSASNFAGEMALTNSICTDKIPLTGILQAGFLTLSATCPACFLTFTSGVMQDYTLSSGRYTIYCGGAFYDQGTFSLDYLGPWQNSTDLENGWWSDWIGRFNTNSAPWIYHQTLGWIYPSGTSADSVWFWDPQWDHRGGWWWTSSSDYPWVYSDTDGGWFYYDAGDSNPQARWFCNSRGCAQH